MNSVPPVELAAGGANLPRLTIDQSHNIEPKLAAMVLSAQEGYAIEPGSEEEEA